MQEKKILKTEYYTLHNIDQQARIFADKLAVLREKHKNQKIETENVALLVIDMQGFFYDPGYHAFIPSMPAIVNKIKLLQEYFFKYNMPVFHTRHGNTLSDAKQMLNW